MQELAIAEKLARQAGHIALEYQHLGVSHYKDNFEGPVTQGDLLADQLIVSGLREAFPGDEIVSEESFVLGSSLPAAERVWFVDPIDGTSDYSKGGNEYVVMIGLCVAGVPSLGVIYQPATGILWRAAENQAEQVDMNGCVNQLSLQNDHNDEGLRLVVSHSWPGVSLPGVSKILKRSSVGLKAAMVADGQADAYVSMGRRIKVWDTCAPAALLTAAGGVFVSISGDPLSYRSSEKHGVEILAASPHAASRIKNLWNSLKRTKES